MLFQRLRKTENILISLTIIILVFITYYTVIRFNDTSNASLNRIREIETLSERVNIDGSVLGYSYDDIAEVVPLPPSSEISSIYNQNSIVNATILSDLTDKQLNEYYRNYFINNEWNFYENNVFEKDNFFITIQIEDGLIKLNYQDKN